MVEEDISSEQTRGNIVQQNIFLKNVYFLIIIVELLNTLLE